MAKHEDLAGQCSVSDFGSFLSSLATCLAIISLKPTFIRQKGQVYFCILTDKNRQIEDTLKIQKNNLSSTEIGPGVKSRISDFWRHGHSLSDAIKSKFTFRVNIAAKKSHKVYWQT